MIYQIKGRNSIKRSQSLCNFICNVTFRGLGISVGKKQERFDCNVACIVCDSVQVINRCGLRNKSYNNREGSLRHMNNILRTICYSFFCCIETVHLMTSSNNGDKFNLRHRLIRILIRKKRVEIVIAPSCTGR